MGLRDFIMKLINENQPPQPLTGRVVSITPFVVRAKGQVFEDRDNKLIFPHYANIQYNQVRTNVGTGLIPNYKWGDIYPPFEQGDRVLLIPVQDKYYIQKILEDFYG